MDKRQLYRQMNIEVIEDTEKFYSENAVLRQAIEYGRKNTKLYDADDYPVTVDSSETPAKRMGQIRLTKNRTFQAAMKLHAEFPDKKVAVLNFASATHPGGGVRHGSGAQEESLCRCSTLLPTLNCSWLWHNYYDVNRAAHDAVHSDACIYSPGVVICKTDESHPQRLAEQDFVTVDVITCAAPNLRHEPANWYNPETGQPVKMDPQQLLEIHTRRAQHILNVAAYHKADILVLGAFGCGAFENDPSTVAQAYRAAMQDYQTYFDVIEFAVFCRESDTTNYSAFEKVFRPICG